MSNLPPGTMPPYPPMPSLYPPPPPPPARFPLLGCFFAISVVGNLLAGILVIVLCTSLIISSTGDATTPKPIPEKHFLGSTSASDKIAIVTIDGLILEGMLEFMERQLEQAGKDKAVKATVLRINSPGGSITASDALWRRIMALREGSAEQEIHARPIVVSMGSLAASGAYYIAAPANEIFAERTTMTGSIGVYASFPNIKELASKYGVAMNTIKAGKIKDSGSLFRELTPEESQVLQDMVDEAYLQFLDVVAQGRKPLTKEKMLERFTVTPLRPDPKAQPNEAGPYTRYRADGGIFSAEKAKELQLIDKIGTLEDAVRAAAGLANLTTFRAIQYQRAKTLTDLLLNVNHSTPLPTSQPVDLGWLRQALTPRIWYLAPGYEAAAFTGIAPR